MCSPLISTQFANLPRWSFVYLTHLGIAFLNGLMQIAVFRFKTQEGELTGHREIAHTACRTYMSSFVSRPRVFPRDRPATPSGGVRGLVGAIQKDIQASLRAPHGSVRIYICRS